jgi:hypothetical protein
MEKIGPRWGRTASGREYAFAEAEADTLRLCSASDRSEAHSGCTCLAGRKTASAEEATVRSTVRQVVGLSQHWYEPST